MTTIDLPGGDRLILHGLSAPDDERGAIVRLGGGRPVWIARPPEGAGQDAFVAMRLEDGALIVDSFQGLNFVIDLDTGRLGPGAFVK